MNQVGMRLLVDTDDMANLGLTLMPDHRPALATACSCSSDSEVVFLGAKVSFPNSIHRLNRKLIIQKVATDRHQAPFAGRNMRV
jgi:hypothetical protein